mgnify:CR=1 FL=1
MQKMAMSYALVLAMTGVVSACDRSGETRMSQKGLEYVSNEAQLIGDVLVTRGKSASKWKEGCRMAAR